MLFVNAKRLSLTHHGFRVIQLFLFLPNASLTSLMKMLKVNLISLSQLLTLKSIFVNQSMHDHQSMHNQQYLLREITPNLCYFYSKVQMTLKLFSHKTCLNQNHPLRLTITNTWCYIVSLYHILFSSYTLLTSLIA